MLLAVSGGADSIAMLHSIAKANQKGQYKLSVITVNHNIREKLETAGDAEFVVNFTKSLNIECILVELKENEVYNLAKERKNGIEEAARFLRYKEFKRIANEINADFILTAHNKNDYYETILMRLFQGAETEAIAGISEMRENFLRPMLEISRVEIENYLTENKLSWREDSTNQEQAFLRNKIRHNLIPALNISFDGWQRGLDKTIEKIKLNNEFINSEYEKKKNENLKWEKLSNKNENKIRVSFSTFSEMDKVFKMKFIQDGINILNSKESEKDKNIRKRIPYSVFKDFIKISETNKKINSGGYNMEVEIEKDTLLFSESNISDEKENTTKSYCYWLSTEQENPKKIISPAGEFIISKREEGLFIKHAEDESNEELGPFLSPACLRSRVLGDEIKMPNGQRKSLKKLINEWKLSEKEREILAILEEKGQVKAIFGKNLGKKNIVVEI